jgi:hypothetical protein
MDRSGVFEILRRPSRGVGLDLEAHVIAEVDSASLLEELQDVGRRSHHSQVDVLRRASALEAQLEHEPALERHRIAGDPAETREEAVDYQELAAAAEVPDGRRPPPDPLFQRLLESERREPRSGG